MLDTLQLTGRARTHVQPIPELGLSLQRDTAQALLGLRAAARADGIDLAAVSGHRDLGRQVAVWNSKFRGERQLLDRRGAELERARLSDREAVDAILIWSALPGASRHHWGTDVDVIDRAALPPGYRLQLTREEFTGGALARFSAWLDEHAAEFGFFRPYATDRGGIMPEPWHLSYAEIAQPALSGLTLEVLAEAVAGASLDAREQVLARLPELYERYVVSVDEP
ncbi:MAG: M15 family metallopeptidase [Steroidobacteraceae bacterium]